MAACELRQDEYTSSDNIVVYKSQSPYQNGQNCSFVFSCATDKHLTLDFKQFDIAESAIDKGTGHSYCPDYVSIDGQKYCGSTAPSVNITENEIEVAFHSDLQNTAKGFEILLACKGICCNILRQNFNILI